MNDIQPNRQYPFEPLLKKEKPAPAKNPSLIDQIPKYLRAYIFQFLDFPALGRAFLVSKEWNLIVSNDLIWKVKGFQIKAPLKLNCGIPYHRQVIDFVRDLQEGVKATKGVHFRKRNREDFPEPPNSFNLLKVKAPAVSDLIIMKKSLKAWDILRVWKRISKTSNLFPRPKSVDPVTIDQILNKAKDFHACFIKNQKEIDTVKSFSFINLNIKYIHEAFFSLINITDLDFRNNKLKELPAEIGKLRNLELLTLGHNQLKELPAEIGKLTNLKEFGLEYNQLEKLPAEIGKLSKLQELKVNDNNLKELPAEIGYLPNLKNIMDMYYLLPFQTRVAIAAKNIFFNRVTNPLFILGFLLFFNGDLSSKTLYESIGLCVGSSLIRVLGRSLNYQYQGQYLFIPLFFLEAGAYWALYGHETFLKDFGINRIVKWLWV